MNLFRIQTIRVKLILIMLTIIFFVSGVLAYASYQSYLKDIQTNIGQTNEKITRQLSENIDNYFFKKFLDLTILPHFDRKLEGLLDERSKMDMKEQYLQDMSIRKLLSLSYLFPIREIASIHLFLPSGDKIELFQDGYESNQTDLRNTHWYQDAIAQNGRPVIADSQMLNYNGKPVPVLSFIRQLNVLETREPYAIFVINVSLDPLAELCRQASFSDAANFVILNGENRIIYSQQPYQYSDLYPIELSHDAKLSFSANLYGKQSLISYQDMPRYAWRILSVIPYSSLSNQTIWIRNTILLATASAIAIGILLALWFSHRITKPILRLRRMMKRVELGDFDQTFDNRGHDEINQLGASFNSMLAKIKNLIENIYLLEIRQKDAQLNTLQSQINPHFLFNTLETIRMIAEVQNNQEVSKLIQSLGNLLQETILLGHKRIPIRQEMAYINNYLIIQSYRHHSLQIEKDVHEDLMDCLIPPLLLQPILENAIEHGVRVRKGKKIICIRGWKEGDDIVCLSVEDNGVGMRPELAEQITQALLQSESPPKSRGIGLWNVQQRIVLQFGKDYGLHIYSKEGQGTRVILRIPVLTLSGRFEPHESV